jgi:hypothetical protein
MAHKDKSTKQYRFWLRPETVQQVRLLTLLLGRDDPNQVCDDMIRAGIAYTNETAKIKLAEWDPKLKLFDLNADLELRVLRGTLPMPSEA